MNWLDLAIVIIVAIGLMKGMFDGFIKQIVSLVSFILAVFFAGKTSKPLREFLLNLDSIAHTISPQIVTVICYILTFILIILVFRWLAKLLSKAMLGPMSCINHALGGLAGCLLSILFLSLIINVLAVIDPDSKIIKEQTKSESVFFYKVEVIVPLISPIFKEITKSKENLPEQGKYKQQENTETASINCEQVFRRYCENHFHDSCNYFYQEEEHFRPVGNFVRLDFPQLCYG